MSILIEIDDPYCEIRYLVVFNFLTPKINFDGGFLMVRLISTEKPGNGIKMINGLIE